MCEISNFYVQRFQSRYFPDKPYCSHKWNQFQRKHEAVPLKISSIFAMRHRKAFSSFF